MRQRNLEGRTPEYQRSADFMRVSAVIMSAIFGLRQQNQYFFQFLNEQVCSHPLVVGL
jgi:hypothetical protein